MFVKRNWVTRVAEFMGRRKLTTVGTGEPQIIIADVERYEGGVTEEGTPFSSGTMNDLEERIENAFNEDALRFTEIETSLADLPDMQRRIGVNETSINSLITKTNEIGAQAELNRQNIGLLILTSKVYDNTVSLNGNGGSTHIDVDRIAGYKAICLGPCYCGGTNSYIFNFDQNSDVAGTKDRIWVTNRSSDNKSLNVKIFLVYLKNL